MYIKKLYASNTYWIAWFTCHAIMKSYMYAFMWISFILLLRNSLGFFKVLYKAKIDCSQVICNSYKICAYVIPLPSVPHSFKYVLILLYNCAYILCCAFSSISKGYKIIVACMGGPMSTKLTCFPPYETFIHVFECLHFCNNKYCSSPYTSIVHKIILSLYA